jgi:hypothetical protein
VLTYTGTSTIASLSTDAIPQLVYNLEVKDLHNFLVGSAGVVVHNTCDLTKYIKGLTGAKGLKGLVYEDWLHRNFPNASKPGNNLWTGQAREYDIKFELDGKGVLGEAKSDGILDNLDKWNNSIKSQLGQQAKDAIDNGYDFYLFSNTKIPSHVKLWCESKGIKFLETLN